ncbi:MAG: transcription antitermination factor NusB [Eubacteriales bacterium]|nr:transcription antitermination factor NusB [Eubacteriales bacterium]
MTRNEAREIMMQILYEIDASNVIDNDTSEDKAAARARAVELSRGRLPGAHADRGAALFDRIISSINDIDSSINSHSAKWKTSRMPKVDLAIMRLACGEINYCDDIPNAVTINEAINLAKKFSTENSARFIHGVLGSIIRDEK